MSENLNETMTVAGNGTIIIPTTTSESSSSNSSVSKTTSTINAATGDHQTQSSSKAFVPRSHENVNVNNSSTSSSTTTTTMTAATTMTKLKAMNLALIGQVQQLMKEKEQDSFIFTNKIDSLTKELNLALFENISLKDELYQAKKNQEKRVLDLQKEVSALNKQASDDKDRIESFNKQASIDRDRVEALETKLTQVQKTNNYEMNILKEKGRNDKKKIMDLQKDLEKVQKQKRDAMKYIMDQQKEIGRLQKELLRTSSHDAAAGSI